MTTDTTSNDLITTEELLEALGCSKATLAILRRHGLTPLGPGKRKLFRRSAVEAAIRREAGDARGRAPGPNAGSPCCRRRSDPGGIVNR